MYDGEAVVSVPAGAIEEPNRAELPRSIDAAFGTSGGAGPAQDGKKIKGGAWFPAAEAVVFDTRLPAKARLLLIAGLGLQRRRGWKIKLYSHLLPHIGISKNEWPQVRRALEAHGFLTYERVRRAAGKVDWLWSFHSQPVTTPPNSRGGETTAGATTAGATTAGEAGGLNNIKSHAVKHHKEEEELYFPRVRAGAARHNNSLPSFRSGKSPGGVPIGDWRPGKVDLDWACEQFPEVDSQFEADQFVDYWKAKPGAAGCKLDWHLTWHSWIRNAVKYGQRQHQERKSKTERGVDAMHELAALYRKVCAREQTEAEYARYMELTNGRGV